KIDIILFQDYDKGSITPKIIEEVTRIGHENHIPITVDPKKRNFLNYKNVTLFKPNLKELSEGIGSPIQPTEISSLQQAIVQLKQLIHPEMVMLTLSEHGIAIDEHGVLQQFPAFLRHIADVSGAGDTVISVASLCLTLNMPIEQIAQISNLAGGLVCEQVGVVPINKELLFQEALRLLL
ncbi:MAG: PfkB family carbohydrate kinase, partial [Bacteroidales bacterium]|nr:PfkB family carbohydrate kinase [Bacteroidales bacterium]